MLPVQKILIKTKSKLLSTTPNTIKLSFTRLTATTHRYANAERRIFPTLFDSTVHSEFETTNTFNTHFLAL
jgi:hypothetical protein